MSVNDIIMTAGGGASAPATYIEDVFSTYLYTGNGSTQTITNGIDLAGKGGLVWIKARNQTGETISGAYITPNNHYLFDTARRNQNALCSSSTIGQDGSWGSAYFNFLATGFDTGTDGSSYTQQVGTTYTSWTFRRAPKFFDVVTWTGNGANNRNISHALASIPGCIFVKRTDSVSNWIAWHRSTDPYKGQLNTTAAFTDTNSSIFGVGATGFLVDNYAESNANGGTYVAYLFAHNAGGFGPAGTDNVISCGSFTTDASGIASVNLGYEPQWVLLKQTTAAQNWLLLDNMRGFTTEGQSDKWLVPNSSAAESTGAIASPTATGFTTEGTSTSATYIYIAIRRGPMKTPTSGTSVFAPVLWTANSPDPIQVFTSFAPDFATRCQRSKVNDNGLLVGTRLTGPRYLNTPYTNAEETYLDMLFKWDKPGGNAAIQFGATSASNGMSSWLFRRAPGFFDVVCYTGTGSARTVNHNLGVAPELMIVKWRSGTIGGWPVYVASQGANRYGDLSNYDVSGFSSNSTIWGADPNASVFTVNTSNRTNGSGVPYVAYLFATCPGVSKVGSYTGSGSSQTINCGFAAGARFVLIKRTDNTGDWYVWDTARGIVAGNDPHLSLNTTAAEVTTDDTIDPNATGFIVNQVSATNVNVNAASYIYLAIA